MTELTDAQIYANRKLVIDYLKKPNLRKTTCQLRDSKGGRCCLGHMSDALGVKYVLENGEYYYGAGGHDLLAPDETVIALGLWDSSGGSLSDNFLMKFQTSLAMINDETKTSPKAIGEYLETVILGGKETPWTKIKVKGI